MKKSIKQLLSIVDASGDAGHTFEDEDAITILNGINVIQLEISGLTNAHVIGLSNPGTILVRKHDNEYNVFIGSRAHKDGYIGSVTAINTNIDIEAIGTKLIRNGLLIMFTALIILGIISAIYHLLGAIML